MKLGITLLLTAVVVGCGSDPPPDAQKNAEGQDQRWFRYQQEYLEQTREAARFANERQAEHIRQLKDAGIDPGEPIR